MSKYLKRIEWSMGHRQCPECGGGDPSWYGHPLHRSAASIGHKRGCELAAELPDALYQGQFKPTDEQIERAKKRRK